MNRAQAEIGYWVLTPAIASNHKKFQLNAKAMPWLFYYQFNLFELSSN